MRVGWGFPSGSVVKNLQRRRLGFDSWVRKVPEGGHGNSLQYSCLENPMDRGALQVTVHGVTKTQLVTSQLLTEESWNKVH